MERCIFCEIVAGRASASLVYEDELAVAFMDLMPVTKGHLLVVPRQHVRNLYDCPPELAAHLMVVTTQLAGPVRQATGCEGFNVFVANEPVAGQEVWHLHVHLLPRYTDDGFGFHFPPGYPQQAERQALDEAAAQIRVAIDAA